MCLYDHQQLSLDFMCLHFHQTLSGDLFDSESPGLCQRTPVATRVTHSVPCFALTSGGVRRLVTICTPAATCRPLSSSVHQRWRAQSICPLAVASSVHLPSSGWLLSPSAHQRRVLSPSVWREDRLMWAPTISQLVPSWPVRALHPKILLLHPSSRACCFFIILFYFIFLCVAKILDNKFTYSQPLVSCHPIVFT